MADDADDDKRRIGELEAKLEEKDRRIAKLREEIDELRETQDRLREHIEEGRASPRAGARPSAWCSPMIIAGHGSRSGTSTISW